MSLLDTASFRVIRLECVKGTSYKRWTSASVWIPRVGGTMMRRWGKIGGASQIRLYPYAGRLAMEDELSDAVLNKESGGYKTAFSLSAGPPPWTTSKDSLHEEHLSSYCTPEIMASLKAIRADGGDTSPWWPLLQPYWEVRSNGVGNLMGYNMPHDLMLYMFLSLHTVIGTNAHLAARSA